MFWKKKAQIKDVVKCSVCNKYIVMVEHKHIYKDITFLSNGSPYLYLCQSCLKEKKAS